MVVANILAGPLKQLAPCLAGHCEPGGSITLSGILAGQQARSLPHPSSNRICADSNVVAMRMNAVHNLIGLFRTT